MGNNQGDQGIRELGEWLSTDRGVSQYFKNYYGHTGTCQLNSRPDYTCYKCSLCFELKWGMGPWSLEPSGEGPSIL